MIDSSTLEGEVSAFLHNVGNHQPSDTGLQPKGLESSTEPLWKSHLAQLKSFLRIALLIDVN
jgi:hypothetical protein